MNINNFRSDTVVTGTESNDLIKNYQELSSDVTINALGGDDTIQSVSRRTSINAGAGNDSIYNDRDSGYITVLGGKGDDSITFSRISIWGHNLVIYNAGDGNDLIEGLTGTSTLSIADTGYATTTSGNDLIVYVEDGSKITLKGVTPAYISGRPGKFVEKNLDNTENNILIIGSDSKNRVTNSGKGVTILTNGGRDSISNRGQNAKIDGGDGNDEIHNSTSASGVSVTGGAGKDSIENQASKSTITGGEGNDSIFNTGEYTSLDGGVGDDTITNIGASATVTGGEGNDSIRDNGIGNAIFGGEGNDKINIEASRATVEGGKGDDRIDLGGNAKNALIQYTLGDGNDSIYGFSQDATLDIGDGNSASIGRRDGHIVVKFGENEIVLVGAAYLTSPNIRGLRDEVVNIINGKSDTLLVGGNFDDSIYTGIGRNVTVFAQGGNDTIKNETGKNAIINGGTGNDWINNNNYSENSSIYGGDGNDTILNHSRSKNVLIDGGADNDFIDNSSENVTISGGAGNDYISNDSWHSSISGGAGNDTISNTDFKEYRRDGSNVTINGGAGDDYIVNENGARALFQYNFGDGNDVIKGFRADSRLSIAGGIYTSEKSGNDVIVTVGDGKITLQGAASLKNVNIIETPVNIHNADRYKYITLTNANDTIINTGGEVTIQALRGNDSINNNAPIASIDAGEGNDKISNTGRFSTILGNGGNDSIYNNAYGTAIDDGAGDDYIFSNGGSVKIFGNVGKNTIENYNKSTGTEIRGGTDNDSIKNSSNNVKIWSNNGNDTIYSNGSSNLIDGEEGDDLISIEGSYENTIYGGKGNDTINLDWSSNKAIIRYNKGDGNDVINGFNATSTLSLGNGKDTYIKSIEGEDVIVTFGEGNITLKGAATLAKVNISGFTSLNANNTLNGATIIGDRLNDSVKNSGNRVTIQTFAGNDSVENSGSRVLIEGGLDDDSLSNIGGNNVTILGNTGKNSLSNTNGNFVSIVGDSEPDYISDTNGSAVTIDAGDHNDTIIVSNGFRNVINGGNNLDYILDTNSRNDTIYGGDGFDTISVSGGFRNVINGGKLADIIYLSSTESGLLIQHNAGDGDDAIHGFNSTATLQLGDGTDTFERNTISSKGDVIIETGNEKIYLRKAATLSTVHVLGSEYVPGKAFRNDNANTVVSGTAGGDRIRNYAGGQNSTILGNAGDDDIRNSANKASISGGAGNDKIYNNKGRGTDSTIDGGAGNDIIYNNHNEVSISGGAGVDSIENSGENVTIDTGDGNDYINTNYRKTMIQYTAGDGNDTISRFASNSTLGIAGADFTTTKSGNDIIVAVGSDSILIENGATLSTVNIIHDKRELPLNIANTDNDISLVGTSRDDTISNSGAYVTISAQEGNDSISNGGNNSMIDGGAGQDNINNTGSNVTISAGAGNDSIVHDYGFYASVSGGEGKDFITVTSSSQVTVNAGKANDVINLQGNDGTLIEYNAGDGNDLITGFDKNSTLNIAKTTFTTATSVKDLIITVGDGKITLDGAASLSSPNISNGTFANFTIKNSAVTYNSDLPESIIKDAYKFKEDSSTLSISSALQNYTVNVKAENAGKVNWHYGTASLNSASTLEYKLDNKKNSVTLTSKNYGDKITIDGDADFNFGLISAEVFKNGTISTKSAKRILFENNSSANVTAPRNYQIDVDTSNIMLNDFPINAKTGAGTVTVGRRDISFSGYGAQFVDLEVAKESYFGKLAPMTVVYNTSDNSYTVQNTACIKTLSSDFTKIKFDFANKGDEKYAHYKVNDVAFLIASDEDDINVVETDGTNFKIQDKEINAEKIGRITLDEQITFSGSEIDFEGVKTTYTHNKPVSYSLDGNTITLSDAASVETTGDETKTFKCEAGSYTINGKTFETSAALTFTANTNEIKIPMSNAKTEIYFDGVQVSGISDGGEIVFDLTSGQTTIPSGATLNVNSAQEVKLNLAAGNFTIDGKKLSLDSALEITADKDNINVPLSSNPVTINGAKITGTNNATIDNTLELFCSVLLPNGAFVQNTSESIYQLSGEGSTASFGNANKKVQLTDNSTSYIEYYRENIISVGFNRFMFETVEIKGNDAWTIETAGTNSIDKITGIKNGATITTSTEYVDAGDLRFEVETDGKGEFNICGQKITSTSDDKNTYVVYGNFNGEIKVVPQGEEYAGDDSEPAGNSYQYTTAGDYTLNGITFHATANAKVQTITRGVEFDLSSGTFQYDGLTLSGGGIAQINRYNAKLVSLTDGAKVSGSDESKYNNRQFEISGAVELAGKKFDTNEQIRCGLINAQDTIEGQTITLRGFYVDDKYVNIQSDCYDAVKVVDKNISSIEGVKNSAEILGNGLSKVSIVTTESGEFTITGEKYKINDDPDGAEFVTDSHGNIAEINGLTGSVEGDFENGVSVNGKAIQITGASSIKVTSDGTNITEISNVAGDLLTTDGRKNVRVYELGGTKKLTTSAKGTIIFSGGKAFEMSAGKTFELDEAGNISGIETVQSDSATSAANILETSEEDFSTINLSTTSGLDEVIGDFSEGVTVNGVLVRVTDSTNFAVKNDAENVYIETNAPDTFTINGKTFETSADKTIFKLDKDGNVCEIVTDRFYLYPDNETYLIDGDFSDEIIFNGQKFCVTGTNDITIFIGEETSIGVELARNAVEVVESGDASEIALSGGGDITIGGKTFSTSDDFIGLLQINSLDSFIGTISGELGGLDLVGITIESDDEFSATGDGEKVTAIENLQNGTLTSEDLDAITINGEKLTLDDSDEVTLTIADGEVKTSAENENPAEEISYPENAKVITENTTLKGGDVVVVEDTAQKLKITASKGNDTIYTSGKNVEIDFKGGKTEVFATGGKMKVSGYNASTGSGFHTDYADIFAAVDEGDIVFNKGRLTIGSALVIDEGGNNVVNFFDTTGELQKVGRAFTDTALNLSKETADLVLYADKDSTLTGGSGSDSIFAFEGSFVDAGAGNNYIYLEERGANADGVTILLNGKNTVENFNATFDGDKISVDATNHDFSFDGANVSVKSGSARALLQNISSDDDAARILTLINGKEIKTAIAQEGLIIAAGDDTADAYYGEKSGVDFTGYSDSLTVDLNKNFYGINRVTLGGGQNTLLSSSGNETLASSDGTTEFIFNKDSGRDVINNFNFDGDKINVGNETITAVNVNSSGGVRMEISGSATLTLEDAQGKNFRINNFVALLDKNLTYNAEANYFAATSQNATLTINEGAEIWLDGSHGKIFSGDIRTLDASTSDGRNILAGNDLDNTIRAGSGDSSLWGGNLGNDFMQGGTGKNTFFYTGGNGSDTIAGANNGDVVNLAQMTLDQIASTNITADAVTLNFKDGGSLQINSAADITYQLADGSKFSANHAQATWIAK